MKNFKLLLFTTLLALAPMASQGATFDVVGGGNLDAQWDDLQNVNQYGNVVLLRDLQMRGTLNTDSGFFASVQLACDQQQLKSKDDCFNDAAVLAKDIIFGYAKTIDGQEFMVLAGKGTVAFGDSTTHRAIVTNDTIEQLDRQMWRKPILMIKLAPNVSSDTRAGQILSIIKSIEVTAYNNKAGLTNDISQAFSPDSYAARVKYAFMTASGQVSYLNQQGGERRYDASMRVPLGKSGFSVYGNYQNIKNGAVDTNVSNSSLVGVAHPFKGGEVSLEASLTNYTNGNTPAVYGTPVSLISPQAYVPPGSPTQEKRLTGGYSHVLKSGANYELSGKAELSGRVGAGTSSDIGGATRLNVNFTSNAQTTDLFQGSTLEQRVKARNEYLAKPQAN